MENIETILNKAGVELTDEQKAAVIKGVAENYKTVADYDKQKEKLATADGKVTELTNSLEKFKDYDPEEVTRLKGELETKDQEYANKIAERDFKDTLKTSILSARGKDADKIARLLDVETLKASKNQKADIEAAIKGLAEDEMTKGFFDIEQPTGAKVGTSGRINPTGGNNTSYLDDQYKNNPYYHPNN